MTPDFEAMAREIERRYYTETTRDREFLITLITAALRRVHEEALERAVWVCRHRTDPCDCRETCEAIATDILALKQEVPEPRHLSQASLDKAVQDWFQSRLKQGPRGGEAE